MYVNLYVFKISFGLRNLVFLSYFEVFHRKRSLELVTAVTHGDGLVVTLWSPDDGCSSMWWASALLMGDPFRWRASSIVDGRSVLGIHEWRPSWSTMARPSLWLFQSHFGVEMGFLERFFPLMISTLCLYAFQLK